MKITVAYDGTDFAGSQVQPGVRTVQGDIEAALRHLGCEFSGVAFAGRTDKGVHALGQVVSLDFSWSDDWRALQSGLNATTAKDIAVVGVSPVDKTFHARYNAKWREYRYRIDESDVPPVLNRRFSYWYRHHLDADLAQRACDLIVGTYPMGTFAGAGKSQDLTESELTRTIYRCTWRTQQPPDHHPALPRRRHELRIVASGYLPNMVRNIVSTVLTVASGDETLKWVQSVIAANDRRVIGAPAPPEGLVFWRVGYDEERNEVKRSGDDNSEAYESWRGGVA